MLIFMQMLNGWVAKLQPGVNNMPSKIEQKLPVEKVKCQYANLVI